MKTNAQLVWDFNKVFNRQQLEELKDIKSPEEQEKLESQLKLIEEEVGELQDAIWGGDYEALKDAVMDILVVTYGMAYVAKIDADKGVQEVNRANLSKVCQTKEEVANTVDYYNDLGITCSVLQRELEGNTVFIIKSKDNQTSKDGKFYPKGKFLKNINWSEPDLGFIGKVK